jgi:hypothetical protein
MFRTVSLSIIRSFSLYTQQWYTSYRFVDSFRAGSGWNCNSILILLDSCLQNCMTYTIAVCTVKNSWLWTEELSETCTISFQNKFENSVHLVGFIISICHDARSHERKFSLRDDGAMCRINSDVINTHLSGTSCYNRTWTVSLLYSKF